MSFIISEDEALKNLLKGFVVSDEKNNSREVEVWFSKPDIESRNQSFPFITVELLDINWASYRQASGLIVDNDAQGTIAPSSNSFGVPLDYTYELPVAWDLMYQITSYSRHPRHDRAIMANLLNRVFPSKRGYLAVTNELGTETGYRHLILEEFTKRDVVEDGRRLYRNIFTVTVSSEGSANVSGPKPVVEDVFLNSSITHIPIDLQHP